MAETDILNPTDWQDSCKFNPNPSYGFTRKPSGNRQLQRPRLGPFNSRDLMNGGHIFSLSWVGTTLEISDRVTNFYHDFKDGYFTYIDVDGGGRHYVGRFTTEPNPQHTANGKWNVEGVTFEELPTARMLEYPNDLVRYGHSLYVVEDFLKPRVALMQGAWALQVSPLAGVGASATAPASYEAYCSAPALGDWAQTQYVGWGFSMDLRIDPSFGLVDISLDGTRIVTLDLAVGTQNNVNALVATQVNPPLLPALPSTVNVTMTNVPLDAHRIKIASAGMGSSSGIGMVFPAVRYIY